MKTYCVKCKKDTEYIDLKKARTKNNTLIMPSKYPVCGIKKSCSCERTRSKKFIK